MKWISYFQPIINLNKIISDLSQTSVSREVNDHLHYLMLANPYIQHSPPSDDMSTNLRPDGLSLNVVISIAMNIIFGLLFLEKLCLFKYATDSHSLGVTLISANNFNLYNVTQNSQDIRASILKDIYSE